MQSPRVKEETGLRVRAAIKKLGYVYNRNAANLRRSSSQMVAMVINDLTNPFYTEFHKEAYDNFAAWPIDARLYEKRDFQRSYPHFYVNSRADVADDVKDLDRFDAVECTGIVKHIFRGRPHIEVVEVDGVNYGMEDDEIKAAIRAHAHYLAGHYDRAEKLYVRAMTNDVPSTVRADLNRRLGDARFGAKRYQSAMQAYKRALRDAPKSAVLKRNIAACRTTS